MIEIIFLDVDGSLSDGALYKGNAGEELKRFDVKDGFGIEQWIKNLGKKAAIITGKKSQIVENRAKELGIEFCFQGVKNKLEVASNLLEELGLGFENSAAIGDDLNDLKLLKSVSYGFIPQDGIINDESLIRLYKKAGHGAVREMIEFLVVKENLQEKWLEKWL